MLTKTFLPFTLITLVLGFVGGCGGGGGGGDDGQAPVTLVPPQAQQAPATQVSIVATDAESGEPVSGSLRVSDNGAGALANGGSPQTINVENGLATVFLRDNTNFPVNLSVSVLANGFLSNPRTIQLTGAGLTNVEAPLVKLGKTPTGVTATQVSQSLADGDIDVTVDNTANGQMQVSVKVPSSVELQNADGERIDETEVNLTVGAFGIRTRQSVDTFPGGFTALVKNPNAIPAADAVRGGLIMGDETVEFLSLGFASVDMTTSSGQTVKQFANGTVDVTVGVPPNAINPNTNQAVACGDTVPVWSQDADTGIWEYEADGQVQQEGNPGCANTASMGALSVTFPTDHLSYFNLDYFRGSNGRCSATLNVIDQSGNSNNRPIRASLRRISGTGYSNVVNSSGSGAQLTFNNAPRDVTFELTLLDRQSGLAFPVTSFNGNGNVSGNQITDLDPCDSIGSSITVNSSQLPPPVTVNVITQLACPNNTNVRSPLAGYNVYVYPENAPYGFATANANGESSFQLPPNRSVRVQAYNSEENRYVSQEITTPANGSVSLPFVFVQAENCDVSSAPTGGTGGSGNGF